MFQVCTASTKRLVAIDTKTHKPVGEARRVKIDAEGVKGAGWLLTMKGRKPQIADTWDDAGAAIRAAGAAVRIEDLPQSASAND